MKKQKVLKESNLPFKNPFLITVLAPIIFDHYQIDGWEKTLWIVIISCLWLGYILSFFFTKKVNVFKEIKKVKQKESESTTVE
jgi:hypothetical protein